MTMRRMTRVLLFSLISSKSRAFVPKGLRTAYIHQSSSVSHVPDFMSQLFSTPPKKEEVDPGVVDGTDLRIVKYPHPALRAENAEISSEELKDSKEIADLAKGMLKVMYAAEGVGLAAPQVGVNKRLMVYNPSGDSKKWLEETILVNPKIVEYSEGKDTEIEGCLSFPDMNGEVTRSKWIKVQATNLKGRPIKKKFTGWEARIFQHNQGRHNRSSRSSQMNAPERSSAFLLDEDSGEQKCVYTADTKVSRYNHHLDFISRFDFCTC